MFCCISMLLCLLNGVICQTKDSLAYRNMERLNSSFTKHQMQILALSLGAQMSFLSEKHWIWELLTPVLCLDRI